MKQTIAYKDGNALSYSEFGDRTGYPILVQHGMIASISDYHLFDRLVESGRRVVCIARPGYGESSPYPMENLAEWGEIVSVLVEALELSQFDVLGMSSGAPYSYAIGYKIPEKVRNIYIFSGIPALYDESIIELWPYEAKRNTSIAEMQKLAKEIFFPSVTKEDLARSDIRDSMMNDCFGIAQDLRLRCMDWGFTLSEVRAPVYMEHSRTDPGVPLITAQMTAQLLPDCHLEIREGEHFSEALLDRFIRNTVLRQE
jgi:pimeloyl-ACP methyl ester carboxylesterase